ncbi:MAG: purine-nucleoside phosphorylase [Caldicoprobacterales bacterium]|jgi:purine-nucleoside phosphorylase|nr:purine-nucleoside phosphorylase [Clostridiales bacterium]
MSIHINAPENAIADKVLLPGDPLRAKHVAETFLTDVVCYNTVRNMLGFTGTYKGKRVSVQGTGMGVPSIGIYAYELMTSYKVKTAIRIGTCGTIHPDIGLREVVAAIGAATDSNVNIDRFGTISYAPTADFELMRRAYEAAKQHGIHVTFGNVYTSDKFYDDRLQEKVALLRNYGVLAVEMETAELYTLAARHGVSALTLLTVSDSIITNEQTSAEERQTTFHDMVEIALEII